MCTFLSTYAVLSGHVDMLACFVNKLPNFLGITYPSAAFVLPSQSCMLSRTHVLVTASLGGTMGLLSPSCLAYFQAPYQDMQIDSLMGFLCKILFEPKS